MQRRKDLWEVGQVGELEGRLQSVAKGKVAFGADLEAELRHWVKVTALLLLVIAN